MASLCENLLGFGHPMFVPFVTLTGNTVYKFYINDKFNNSYCTLFPFKITAMFNGKDVQHQDLNAYIK